MEKKEIKYIGFYDVDNSLTDRNYHLGAKKKMNYISKSINKAGYMVNIISPSWMGEHSEKKFELQKEIQINKKMKATFAPSFKTETKLGRNFKIILSLVWLLLYLLLNTKKNEVVLAYHVQWISLPIRIAKKIKRFQLILEVEEIYGEVWKQSNLMSKWEMKLLHQAEKYIFVSDLLQKSFENKGKDNIVLYGAYDSIQFKSIQKKEKDIIDLIYAGSIDQVRGGAYKAIEIMALLPEHYKLHILGDGNKEDVDVLMKKIDFLNKTSNRIACVYRGVLHGEEFTNYLMNCDVALNPQYQGKYMNTAFPSKILTYLSHNLIVISTPIESIKKSKISSNIIFTKNDKAESFVEEIKKVRNFAVDSHVIKDLDEEFVINIEKLINT